MKIDNEYSDLSLYNVTKSKKIYSIEEIIEMCRPIFEKYNIDKVYIFGSYARGEATKDSDIDLLIAGNGVNKAKTYILFIEDLVKKLKKEIDIIKEENLMQEAYCEEERILNKMLQKNINETRRLIYG